MAKWAFKSSNLTFTAAVHGTAIATASSYMALKGGSATQTIDILEVSISGKAVASAVAAIELARAEVLETTPTALAAPHSNGPLHPATAALAAAQVPFVTAGTHPTPSDTVTDAKLNFGLNLFGGIYRWNASPTQQWTQVGATAPGGESVLWNNSSAGGATGLADAHILYEPY